MRVPWVALHCCTVSRQSRTIARAIQLRVGTRESMSAVSGRLRHPRTPNTSSPLTSHLTPLPSALPPHLPTSALPKLGKKIKKFH